MENNLIAVKTKHYFSSSDSIVMIDDLSNCAIFLLPDMQGKPEEGLNRCCLDQDISKSVTFKPSSLSDV